MRPATLTLRQLWNAPQSSRESTEVSQAFRQQALKGLAQAVSSADGETKSVTLTLQPESLGRMTVSVSVRDGVATTRFEVQTPEARDLLVASMPELRASLEATGLGVNRFETVVTPITTDQPHEPQTSTHLQNQTTPDFDPASMHSDPGAGDTPHGQWRHDPQPESLPVPIGAGLSIAPALEAPVSLHAATGMPARMNTDGVLYLGVDALA